MRMTTTALPGFDSPAIGFEQPFEMLEACHDRVRRSLALLGRLIEHIDRHGHDDKSRGAASDVLRYQRCVCGSAAMAAMSVAKYS
jgi:hypothetical protein